MSIRVGFLTTIDVNVGDEFIREGIRAVLDRTGVPYRPFYVNKHDRSSLSAPCGDEAEVVFDKFWDVDVFIQSGAPVYWHLDGGKSTSLTSEWHEWMWEARIFDQSGRVAPRFLNLGAGSCQPWGEDGSAFLANPGCVDFARRAGTRADLTTVRDPVSARILGLLDVPHRALPCPAFLAAMRHRPASPSDDVIAVNLMPLSGHYQLDPAFDSASWLVDCFIMVSRFRKLGRLVFIAHDESERRFISQFSAAGERIFHSLGWRDYLDIYSGCSLVVANRVHGAVCAAGFLIPSIIIGNDTRATIGDYIGIPRFQGGSCDPGEVIEAASSLLHSHEVESARLRSLQQETVESYVELLTPLLSQDSRRTQPSIVGVPAHINLDPPSVLEPVSRPAKGSPADDFACAVTAFARRYEISTFQGDSDRWACTWLWLSGLRALDWANLKVANLNSGSNPMPWFIAGLGASVTLLASDSLMVPVWKNWRARTGFDVRWHIMTSGSSPFPDHSFDAVTAFSPQNLEAKMVTREADRMLGPGGILALSFPKSFLGQNGFDLDASGPWINSEKALGKAPYRVVEVKGDAGENTMVALLLQKAGTGGARLPVPTLEWDYAPVRTHRRIEDLMSMRNALEAYRAARGAYPPSSGGWDGLYTRWGRSTVEWIPGLAPDFLTKLPRDPAQTDDPERQYLYRSDGVDFKLICHGADDCEAVQSLRPWMPDPVRVGWAYGLWSSGGATW